MTRQRAQSVRLKLLAFLDYRLIHEEYRDAVPDGIDAVAFAALQGLSLVRQHEALLAQRAYQDVKQVRRNHTDTILLRLLAIDVLSTRCSFLGSHYGVSGVHTYGQAEMSRASSLC